MKRYRIRNQDGEHLGDISLSYEDKVTLEGILNGYSLSIKDELTYMYSLYLLHDGKWHLDTAGNHPTMWKEAHQVARNMFPDTHIRVLRSNADATEQYVMQGDLWTWIPF